MLNSQMEVSRDIADEANPFILTNEVTDSDVEEAAIEAFVVDEDESDDELVEVEDI